MSVAENRDEGRRSNVITGLFGGSDLEEALSREQIRTRLLMEPEQPTWGPKGGKSRMRRIAENMRRGKLAEGSPEERALIEENYELHRRIYSYRPMYLIAAITSFLIACVALYVDFNIIEADVWTRALADEFGIVPSALQNSVFYKSLQVVFATLAIHFMLKVTGYPGRIFLVVLVFILTFAMVGGLGFVVANNNLAAGASGVKSIDGEQPRLGDALAQLGLSTAPASNGSAAATGAAERRDEFVSRTDERCPTGYEKYAPDPSLCRLKGSTAVAPLVNLNLQDWFVFKSLPEEWRRNAQINLWLVFVSVIFFIITAVAALYLQSAERNIRNFFDARDFLKRREAYLQYANGRADA